MTAFPEFHKFDGMGLAELVRTKQVTPTELVEEAIRRIEVHNPKINAVIYKMYDQARRAAKGELPDGPFKGVPFLLKDWLVSYAGVPTSSGNRLLKDIPMSHDSESVRRFKAAGLIILGKTNVSEFGALQPSSRKRTLVKLIGSLKAHRLLNAAGVMKRLAVAARTFDFIPYTPPFNVTGQPAMSVPFHWDEAGLPVGMHFAERFGDEATLFRLAGQIERAQPWFNRAPAGFGEKWGSEGELPLNSGIVKTDVPK